MVNNNDDHRVPQWLSHVVVLAQVVFGTWHYVWVVPLLAMMTEDLSTRVWDTDLSCVVNFGTPAGEVREKDPVL